MRYTTEQVQMIRSAKESVHIAACAGSGKTVVLAARVTKLLESGVRPSEIVAITYTDKAATELRERIHFVVEQELVHVPGLPDLFVGTFHSWCHQLLRSEIPRFAKYEALCDVRRRLLVNRELAELGIDTIDIVVGRRAGARLTSDSRDIRLFLTAVDTIREECIAPQKLPKGLRRALNCYLKLLARERYLDFAQMQTEALKALHGHSEDCLRMQQNIHDTVKYLLIDESQDSSHIQFALIERLKCLGASVTLVGDLAQTLYGFRGANGDRFHRFTRCHADMESRQLTGNFRSSSGIVTLANSFLPTSGQMTARSHILYERGDLLALRFANIEEEAVWIAEKIQSMVGTPFQDRSSGALRGLEYGDFAILVRSVRGTDSSVPALIAALKTANIPLNIGGMGSILQPLEAQAFVACLDFVSGNIPSSVVRQLWLTVNISISEKALDLALAYLESLKEWSIEAQGYCCFQSVLWELMRLLRIYEEDVSTLGDNLNRSEIVMSNLGRISQALVDFQDINYCMEMPRKAAECIEWLRTEAPAAYEGGAVGRNLSQNAVQIMTMHAAKGAEWPVVFLPSLVDGDFPWRSSESQIWTVLPRRLVHDAGRYDVSLRTERSVFYVGLTRSRKWLFATYAPVVGRYSRPSPFFLQCERQPLVIQNEPEAQSRKLICTDRCSHEAVLCVGFTELSWFFACPYQFKMRAVFGFSPPISTDLAYGKCIHRACAELHERLRRGELISDEEIPSLVGRHWHLPFATRADSEQRKQKAVEALNHYRQLCSTLSHAVAGVEQSVEFSVGNFSVTCRIDAVLSDGNAKVILRELKTSAKEVEREATQLLVYALAYAATKQIDVVGLETIDVFPSRQVMSQEIQPGDLQQMHLKLTEASAAIRARHYVRLPVGHSHCASCDMSKGCINAHNPT